MLDQVTKQYKLRQVGINYYGASTVHISILHSTCQKHIVLCPLEVFKINCENYSLFGGGEGGPKENYFQRSGEAHPHAPSHPHTRLNHTYYNDNLYPVITLMKAHKNFSIAIEMHKLEGCLFRIR